MASLPPPRLSNNVGIRSCEYISISSVFFFFFFWHLTPFIELDSRVPFLLSLSSVLTLQIKICYGRITSVLYRQSPRDMQLGMYEQQISPKYLRLLALYYIWTGRHFGIIPLALSQQIYLMIIRDRWWLGLRWARTPNTYSRSSPLKELFKGPSTSENSKFGLLILNCTLQVQSHVCYYLYD